MSNSSDHPELQKAEKAVAAAEAAVGKAQAVVTDLEAKREAAVKHGTELADERAKRRALRGAYRRRQGGEAAAGNS